MTEPIVTLTGKQNGGVLPDANSDLDPAQRELDDTELVRRVLDGERDLFELIMRRHNRPLSRVIRAILGPVSGVDDVLQDTYVRAYAALSRFEARSSLGTWLTRIAINEARMVLRRRRRHHRVVVSIEDHQHPQAGMERTTRSSTAPPPEMPEHRAVRHELREVLAQHLDALPEEHRLIFVLRHVEQLSTSEAATRLGIRPETARVRLHRTRQALRRSLARSFDSVTSSLFDFGGRRCDGVVARVMARISSRPQTGRSAGLGTT